tara:strand:- start:700 stop:1230 length:531 start_codon:yes stop_codon:yes gene_type:complete
MQNLTNHNKAILDMLTEVHGILDQEKEFILEIPLEHGLNYKFVNYKHNSLFSKLSKCYDYFEKSIQRSLCSDIYNANDLVKRVVKGTSDLWIAYDKDKEIKGCFVIGFARYPQSVGILTEAMSADDFDFKNAIPKIEEYYKELGYEFSEMAGRRGWEKIMAPLGYEFKTVTLRKRL